MNRTTRGGTTQRTTFASSAYRGTRRSASTESGGKVGRGGRFVTRDQRRRDMRIAFGLAGG